MAQDNIHKMYERLSTRFDLGTEEQFRDYVTASTDNSKKMYERMSTRFELGSEQEWLDFMGGAKQQRETAAAKGDAEGASTFSEAEIKAETAAAEPQQVNDLPIPPTQGKSTSGTPTPGAWPYAGAHRMQDGYVVSNAPGRDTGWRLNNEDGTPRTWAENVEAAKTDEQRAIEQFGDYRSGIVQDLLTDHAKTKAVPSERVVVDSEGNEVDRYEVTPELSQEEAEYQARDDYYKKVKLDGERWAELEAARKQVYDEYNKELGKAHKEISELYQYVDAGAPFDIYDKVSNRREVKALQGALKYYDDALTMVKEARAVNDSPNNFLGELAGLGRGLLDAGLDVSTWDMGMSDLDQGASTLSAILKLEAGKELTSAEQRLLAAAAANTYANSSLGEQMGMGYKAGQTTMMSVPFMIEMALNPASGLGSAGSKALSKHLIKKYGREMIQKQLKKRLARQAMAAKWATKVGGDAASAIDMTLTSGAAMTAADAVDRMTGTIKPTEDEEGNIVYGGREDYEKSALTAGFKAVASGAIERQTEMVGGYIPAMKTAGVTFLGKAAKKATNPRLRKIYREAEELLDGKAFGKWGEMVGKVADVTKLNDLAGEFLEEKIGEVENAILVGDMKFDANSQTGIFNLDRNIETLVGLLPMQTFFGGMTLLGYRTQKYRTNQALNKANKAAWETFGEDWIEMKDMIDGCETDKDLTKVVRGIISGGTTDLRSQAAVMQYVSAVQRQKGLQLVAETAPEIVAQAEAEDAAAAAMPQTTENGGAVDAAAIPQPTENGGAVLQTAYDRGVAAAEADDYAAISDIGYQADLADARIERMFDEAQRAEIAEAENTEGGLETWLGNNRESLSAEQAFAVQALIDANDAYDGLTETVRHRSASEEDAIRQEMQPLATADGRIVPLTLDNGQTVYLKSGDPTNRRSTVIAAYRDETGAVRNTQVSGMSITSIGTEQSLSDYALEAMGNINNERQQRIKDAMDGKNVAAGQTVRLYAGDEMQEYEATAVAPEGVTLRSKIDGSEMTMTTEELQDELAMSRQKRIENDLAAAAMPQPTTENAGAAVAAAAQPQPTENADAKEEERRKPLRTRVAQWSKDIGADIEIHEDTNSITSSAVLNQINSGQGRVRGWYDNATGKVHVYMPGITDEHDIDETVIHEIVAHKGLRQLMGPRFDALCDKVYEMMSEDARKKYLAYPGVNGDTRAAADEYMAYLAENMENLTAEEQNVWQTIVAAVREFIKSVMSGSQMTDAQIEQLIRASYLNMKAQREQATEAAAEPQLTENTRAAAAEREQEPAATDQQLAEKENLESQENAEKNVSLQTKEGRMGVVARQKNSAARLAKAKEIYGSDPTTAPFFDDMDVPQTAEELVAMTLVPRSINWEGIDRGTQHIRGLQEEMGRNKKRGIGRNFDTYGFNPYLAKKGEGVGIEKLVEDIWRSDKNGMGEGNMLGDQRRFDEHEIKDALLSLLSGAQTSKDISDYVLNNRIAQAEAAIEYMEEEAAYEQELYEQERREDARLAGILELTEEDWLQMEAEYADKIAEIEAKEREQKEIFQQILEQDHQQVEYYGRANQEEVASERGIRMAEESAERGTVGSAERGETVLRGTQDTREAGLSVGDAELSEGALGAQDGRDGRSEDVHTQEAERSAVGETEALPQFTEELERQKAETNTSPTEAQKEAGNYKKGHLTFGGYKFTIENPKGSVRSGKDKKGKAWKVTMPVTYGYILGKKGKDGDHLDMFINDKADLSTWNGSVFVVDQVNPETGEFDEHKIMYGFNDITDAIRAYLMSYTRPWQGMGNITEVSKEIFDEWVASSDRKLKPFAETRFGDKADVGTKVIRAAEERAGKRQEGETPEQDRDKQIEKAYKRGYNSYRQEQYTDETLLEMYASMSNEAIEADISKMERSIEEEKAYKDSEEYQEHRSNESSNYTRAQTEGVAARAGKSVKALETKIAEAKKVLELRSMAEGSADEGVRFSAVDDGTAAMPQYTEEEQGIVDEAKKNGTWMKAPNGKATNLTEKQWAQVRTKAFKKWFGDWEKAALSNAILLQPSLPIQKHSYNKEDLKAIYNRLQPVHKGAYVIKFFTSAFNKNYRAGGLFAKIVPQLSDILEVSLLAYSEGDNLKGTVRPDGTTHKEHRNVESFDNYVTKVNIEGKDYFVRITVQKEHNGTTGTHSFFVTNVSVYNNSISGASDSTSGGARLTVDAITDAKLQKFFKDSKASYVNSSKIVDENGEPMVVYHGSMHHNFTVFKNNGSGIYFTPDKDAADYGLDANPYAVFINMREPLNLDFEGDVDNEATENHDSLENEYKNAIAEGYDGVVAENTFDGENEMTQIVVHRSNQIKSATDNVGTFDEGNDDIRFSVEDIQEEYDIPSELFDYYKKSIELGNLTAATQALNGIKDVVRQNIGKKLSEFISVYKGIRDVIFDELGDIEKLREERERAALEQYDLMEAARKRAEEEAAIEAEKSRQLEMIVDLDSEYDKALQENDMERAQDLVSEAARRKGYIVTDYKDAHSAPVAQIERKEFTNLDALRDLSDNGFDLNVFALANGISNQPLEIFDRGMERAYMNVDAAGRESLAAIRSAISAIKDQLSEHGEVKDIPKIKVYRAAPKSIKGGLESGGQWVSPSLTYTQAHGEHRHGEGKYRIIEEEVPADELWWDGNDVREWGFDDGRNYVYKNTKNNKKLFDTVTYDDAGKIIPLSKRFNSKKSDVRFRTKKSFEAGSRYEVKERVYNYYESEELDYYESEELVTGAYQTPHQLLEAVRNKHEGYAWKMNDDATEIECLGRWNELLPKKNGRNDGDDNNERIAKKTERAKAMIGDVAKMLGLDVEVLEDTDNLTDKKKTAKGWYDVTSGKITVVLPNHTSNADVMATLLHEGVAHHGLRKMFGEEFDNMLDNVYVKAWAQGKINAIAGENASKERIREATEEYLARLAEDMNFEKATEQKWWDYIRQAFVSMLRKAGVTIDVMLTDNELRYLLWRSYQNLKETAGKRTALETMEDHKKQKRLGVYDGTGRIEPAVAVAEDIRFRFVGEQGAANLDKAEEATTRLDNLSVAREMEEAGKDAKSIKMATGWERGADKKWRYEVDDDIKIDLSANVDFRRRHPEYARYEELKNKELAAVLELGEPMTEEEHKEYDFAKTIFGGDTELHRSRKLKDYVESESLFKNYPELAAYSLNIVDEMEDGASGSFNPDTKTVTLKMSFKVGEMEEVLVHELQHAIQHIEGFAQGGNTRSVQTKAETLKKDVQPLYEMIHDTPEWAEYKMLVNDYFDEYGKDQLDNDKIAEIENRLNEIEDSGVLKEIENKRKELKRKYGADATVTKILNGPFSSFDEIWEQLPSGFYDKFDAYYRLGGEVEARNAAERMGMTAEERRASLASETEDVAREDQVFIFDGLESAAMPQSTKLSASNKAVAMYDKANGTNVKGFFNYLRNNKQAKKGEPTSFHIGNAGSLLEQYGIKGKFMVGQFTFSKEHTDNEDHHLSVNDWVNVINNLNNPLAITSYKGMPNQYRIYTYAMINGKNICVGVNVSLADGEIALSNIISAYGRDINMLLGKEKTNLIYPDIEELKRRISQVSTGHDSPLNATSTASGDKGTEKDSDLQGNDEKNVTRLSWKEGSEKPNSEVSADELRYRESSIEEFGESFGGTKVQFADRERFADDADAMERIERGDKGWYDTATGEVVIITENCADEADMARALLHEKLGHEGLAALFGGEKGVMKWGEYIWKSASESLRKRIAQRADKEGYPLSDRNRWSKAAQEVFADMTSEGTMSNDEYSLWTKARHYVYRALKALNIRIPGSMTDADLRYYVKKTAEALKKTAAEPQTTENREHYEGSRMAARGDGRPRKKRNESQAQYNQRLLEWERRQVANENDPAPEMPELSAEEIRQEYNEYQKGWMARHGLPEDYEPGVTVGDENAQIFDREKHDSNDPYIEMLGYIPEAMRRWREEYHAWEQRNALGEAENVDLLLYNGDSSHRPDDSTSMEAEARLGNTLRERTIFDEISEAVGFDNTPEGAKRHAKNAVINRRKELESASAEDAIFIQGLGKKIEGIAKRLNVKSKDVRSALITLIELPIMRKNKEQAEQEALETINTSEAMNNAHTKLTLDNLRELREQIGDMLSKHVRHKEDQNNQEKWNELYEAAMTLSAALNQMNAGNEGYVALYADDVIAAYKQFEAAYAATAELPSSELLDKLENDETTKELLGEIKDWYDLMYHYIENAGLRGDAGYIAEGYVNHIWDKSKSDPEAYDRYVRLKSANMRHREIPTYADGIAVGLVPKFTDILDIMSYYSRQNIEAVSNRHLLDNLLNLCVDVKNTDGEVVQQLPVVTTASPSFGDRSRYERYEIPGISGDVWVLKDVKGWFNAIFGTERTPGIGPKMRSAAKAYDVLSGILKTIQLSFSFFHAGALTEVSVAQQGPIKGFKDILKYIIVESALKGTMPAYAHPADFKLAASHLVQLGATKDYAAAEVAGFYDKIHEVMQDFRKEHPNPLTWTGELAAALPKYLNKGMSIMLWEYLHDGLKIALFKKLAGDVDKRLLHIYNTGQQGTNQYEDFVTWQESKAYRVLREQMLDEAGQYVNDTFGGQYWELMNVSPTLIKWLRRALLSPDWLISTQRHFFSMFGFGSLYSEGSFREWIKYNTDNLQRLLGKDVPRNELRRMRSKNAKICYLIGVTIFYYAAFNIINAIARAWDEDEEKKKAEEIRKTNPDYKSPYELAYPDGMKWWEYTMLGNSPRHETHLFLGRYEDGTEYYVRWGKQFREFPELFIGKNGFEFPGPLIERMKGKSNPLLRYTEGAFGVLDIHGYNAPYDIQEMRDKYGKEITLLAYTAQQFLPFSVPTQKDKEFKLLDLAMPSQKGFTRWKAVNYFEDFIVSGEMDGIERTYKAAVMNGINAEECLQAAIARVKATQRKEMGDGITDLQGAYERFDASKDLAERKLMRQKMRKYLSQSGWKNFSKADAVEKVQEFINGGKDYEANNGANDSYLMAATAADIAEDWRIDSLYQLTSPIAKELKDMQNAGMSAQEVNAYAKNHEKLLEARKMIGYHRRVVNILKRDIALHKDSAMTNIREKRKELLKTLGENKPENR